MPQTHRRYTLKTKEAKQIFTQAQQKLNLNLENLYGAKAEVETVESENTQIFLIGGKPILFKAGEAVLPTLQATEILQQLPKIVVDMGAIPHVCNGAAIMAPGIVRIEGEFQKGALVIVADEKHGKPLAVGEALLASAEAKATRKGMVVKNLHYVGDEIWNLTKTITP
jgi:PUA domain protein